MKPWFRMYREERGTFAQLPLVARGIAMEILKLTDDKGVIHIGRKSPVDAIAFALGATRSDRRALAQYVPVLLDDGFLVHDGDRLLVPNFPRFQSDDRTPNAPRPSNEPTTNRPRTDHEPTTTAPRTSNETEPMYAQSLGGTERALREESRVEKRREDPPPTSSGGSESWRHAGSGWPAAEPDRRPEPELDELASPADLRAPVPSTSPLTRLDVLRNFAENIAASRERCGLGATQPFIAEMAGQRRNREAELVVRACVERAPENPVEFFVEQLDGLLVALENRSHTDKRGERVEDPWSYFVRNFGAWRMRHAS